MEQIYKGALPNDKTGTKAREAADIINANFAYLDNKITRKDSIVESTGFVESGQDKIMNPFWKWIIDTIDYTNPEAVTINFPYAASGKMRLDMVALTTSNAPVRIPGPESTSSPVSPPLPENMLQAALVLVTDDSVGDPSSPIIGDAFVKKMESQDFIANYGATTVIDQIDLTDDRSSISLIGSATDVKSVQVSGEFIRPGKPHYFKNRTDHDVTIWHLAGTGNIKYFFPNSLDLIVKSNEVIEFNTNANDSSAVRFEYVGNYADLTNYYTKSETDTALGLKVDKDGSKVLSDNNYSTSEKNKLASIDATHYLPPLQTTVQLSAMPQASISDKARVYVEDELSDYFYDVTASSGDIAPDDQTGGIGFWRQVAVGGETAASIKTKYESNPDTNAFTDAEQAKLAAISGTNTGNETASSIATINHGATAKTTLVDADEITGQDSASSFSLIRVTCLNVYNYLKAKFDSVYQVILTDVNFGAFINSLTGKTTPVDADSISVVDSADSNKQKKVLLTNFKAYLKTYFDGQYQNITPNVQSVTSSSTVIPISTNDTVVITAQAANLTLANPTGSFQQGQALFIRIKDNGTSRTITYGSNYRAIGVNLPTATVVSKTTYIAIIYNSTDTKWDIIGVKTQV